MFEPKPRVKPGIQLELKDEGTGVVTSAKLSLHDAKNLFKVLGNLFASELQANPNLFTTVPKCVVDVSPWLPAEPLAELPQVRPPFELPQGLVEMRRPEYRPKATITLGITDEDTGFTTKCRLSNNDARQLYLSFREIFGDYERQDAGQELFTSVPKCSVNVELQVYQKIPKVGGNWNG